MVQLCSKLYGCSVCVSASSEAKVSHAVQFGATGGVPYRGTDYKELCLQPIAVNGGKPFDLAFDCVGPMHDGIITSVLGMDAKWVLYGLLSKSTGKESNVFGKLLRKRLTLTGFTLRNQPLKFKSELVDDFKREILPRFADKTLQAYVDSSVRVAWSDQHAAEVVEEAHRKMKLSKNMGKMVIEFEQ